MVPMNVVFVGENDPPPWSGNYIDCGTLEDVNVLEGGMNSGLPSIAVRLKLPVQQDGMELWAVGQQTARQIVTLAKMLMAKYPKLMFDDVTTAKDVDILRMLQELQARDMDIYVLTRAQLDVLIQQFAGPKGDL